MFWRGKRETEACYVTFRLLYCLVTCSIQTIRKLLGPGISPIQKLRSVASYAELTGRESRDAHRQILRSFPYGAGLTRNI
jgi:hypothetical protein